MKSNAFSMRFWSLKIKTVWILVIFSAFVVQIHFYSLKADIFYRRNELQMVFGKKGVDVFVYNFFPFN